MAKEQKSAFKRVLDWEFHSITVRDLLRVVLVILMYVVILANYKRLNSIDVRSLIESADSPAKAILIVFVVYFCKAATMVVPAAVVNIAVGLSFPTWEALILNLIGTIMELVIAYAIGAFASGESIQKSLKRNKYSRKLLEADPRKMNITMFFVRLMPFLPIDLISLFYGNIHYTYWKYIVVSLAGIMPRMILFTVIGNAAYKILPPMPAGVVMIILAVLITVIVGIKTVDEIRIRRHPELAEQKEEEESAKPRVSEDRVGGTKIASIVDETESTVKREGNADTKFRTRPAEPEEN